MSKEINLNNNVEKSDSINIDLTDKSNINDMKLDFESNNESNKSMSFEEFDKSSINNEEKNDNIFFNDSYDDKQADKNINDMKIENDNERLSNANKSMNINEANNVNNDNFIDNNNEYENIINENRDIKDIYFDNDTLADNNMDVKLDSYEIDSNLEKSLKPFEQENWDNLNLEQREKAIYDLRDAISDNLDIQNIPDVSFYSNEDLTDYGGYSYANNTIYINESNINDSKETADTIAHESRHCWQHEYADKSDSSLAQEFRENFDDYIRPEDDYRGYKNQPVEADAREYASEVTNNIPKINDNIENEYIETTNHNTNNELFKENEERGPPDDKRFNDIEKKIVNEYSTKIDDKVTEVPQERISHNPAKQKEMAESFKDGVYRTVITKEPITLYRTYGGKACEKGAFATTEPAINRREARNKLALLTEWGNTCEKEVIIEVPAGTKLHIGRIEKQWDAVQGETLKGDGDQILLPNEWPSSWIKEIRDVKE